MDLNAVIKGGTGAVDKPSTSPVRPSGVTAAAKDHGPTLKIASSLKAPLTAPDGGNETLEATKAAVQEQRAKDAADLRDAKKLQAMIGDKNMQFRTYHDDDSGRSVLEVSDQTTGKVVSQYPSDELLRLYAALREPLVDRSA